MTLTDERVRLSKIEIWVCESCLNRMIRTYCHTPGCAFEHRPALLVKQAELLRDLVDFTKEGG